MKKIRVAVCDDEENVGEIVSGTAVAAFAKKGIAADVETFVSSSALLRRFGDVVFDLMFLDIDMPGTDGIALGEKLRKMNNGTDIIYVSNREDRVFDALKVRPFGFVRKSNFIGDITEAVTRYADQFSGSEVLSGNTGFMTGMNFIGTSHTTSHYSLCTALPRGEWGFMGRIVTDAESYNNTMSCAVRAGTDMILTPNARTFDDIDGMDNSKGYGLDKIQEAAKHQLFVFVNTAGISVDSGLSYAWVALPVVISIVLALGAVAIFVFMVFPAFFVKKKEA